MCKSCRKRKKKGSISGLNLGGIDVQRAVGVGGGAVAAKLLNTPIKKYLSKYITDNPDTTKQEGKVVQAAIAGAKVIGGLLLNTKMDNEILQDAGLGMAAVGGIELVEVLAPNVKLPSLGDVMDNYEAVGNVLEIDLNSLDGTDDALNLEHSHAVAGAYFDPSMELSGADVY